MAIRFTNPESAYPRMTTALWEAGLNVNHKKVWRIMRELLSRDKNMVPLKSLY
ncbi:IS3 family transposase [Paenibacillus sp. PCH8]|uniref:IS3 family transposase n=1 Tax=Paenibacillus sp. PCH8 TaxID=2066524 RepID=UPI0015E369BD